MTNEAALDRLLDEMVAQQRRRVLEHARRLDDSLTEDDIAQPHDVPLLRDDAAWNYEDGVLAGIRAAHAAIRAERRR